MAKQVVFDEAARRALKRGIDKAVEAAVEALKAMAKPVKGSEDVGKIGTIAVAHNPTHIGLKPNREKQQHQRINNQKFDSFII